MTTNMSNTDRGMRLIIAIALIVFATVYNGTMGIIALIIAGIFLLTSYFGYCPLYSLFGNRGKSKKI